MIRREIQRRLAREGPTQDPTSRLHEDAVDDTNNGKAYGDFVGNGEDKVPFAHLVLQDPW